MARPRGYPARLSDEELEAEVQRLLATPEGWPDFILPELTLALIGAGLQEQTRREVARLAELTREAAARADRAARLSLLIAAAALSVSAVTLVVALTQ